MAGPGKSPKGSALSSAAGRRGATRRDPDETDPEAHILPEEDASDLIEEVSEPGSVKEVDDDHADAGDKTQVYDPNGGAGAEPAQFKLIVLAGPKAGAEFPLGPDPVTLGRGADNAISIPDVSVSRKHVRIEPSEDGYLVTDLGSGNGTRVNDQKITSALARHGDEVAVGDTVVQLIEIGAPAVKKGKAKREAQAPSGETAPPTAPTRGDLPKAAPPAPKAAPARSPASGRKRIYAVLAVILFVFLGLGYLRKQRLANAPPDDAAVVEADVDAPALVAEGKKLAKKHQWIAALAKFEEASEAAPGPDVERLIDGAKEEAAFETKLNAGKAALAKNDFVAARAALAEVPERADVYPLARDTSDKVGQAIEKALAEAKSLVTSDKERAKTLVAAVLAVESDNEDALALRAELEKRPVAKTSPVRVTVKETRVEATDSKPQGPAVSAFLAGDVPRALRYAEEADDGGKLLKQLRAFDVNYREGIAKAQAQRAPEAVKALGVAARADKEIAQGRPSKPGREIARQLANMEYLLGLDCKGDEQLDCAARHFRAALDADPDNDLAKKMASKTYARATELYTEAYLEKTNNPERARGMFKKVVDTLPKEDPTYEKAKRWYDRLSGKSVE